MGSSRLVEESERRHNKKFKLKENKKYPYKNKDEKKE